MLTAIRKRLQGREEGGFTLIELMVVVLIIAILIAIAIPTFLGARKRAQDRAAQSNIRNVFTAEKTYFTDAQVYTASEVELEAIEPAIQIQAADPPTLVGNNVSAVLAAGNVVYVSAKSSSGSCFYLKDDAASATSYAKDTDGTCGAAAGQTYVATPW